MKFIFYTFLLILSGCSHYPSKNDVGNVESISNNLILFLEDNDHFELYLKSDTLYFYLEINENKYNEYTYDIYSMKNKANVGRFVYGVNFESSDTLNLYFDCSSISFPSEVCNKWIAFEKESQSSLFYSK